MTRPTQETEENARAALRVLERQLQEWLGSSNWGETSVKLTWKNGQITCFKVGVEQVRQTTFKTAQPK